jgi:hypothetical protein
MKTLTRITIVLLMITVARHESSQRIGQTAAKVTQEHLTPVLDAYAQHQLNRHAANR